MTQNVQTVTNPNPTPPTNFTYTGTTAPNPPNYTKLSVGPPPDIITNPPPFYDDGSPSGTPGQFNAAKAALASGTGATSGGTENSYPGTGPGSQTTSATPNNVGAVPAATSAAAEGAGAETSVTQTYNPVVYNPAGALTMFGCGPALTQGAMPVPNQLAASTLSPATNPALASISPTTAVSGASGTDSITLTGTNFTRQSVAYVTHGNTGIPVRCATTFTSATSLTATVPKRTAAGTSTITVVTGGVVTTLPQTLTYS